jgi:hypothetical protein
MLSPAEDITSLPASLLLHMKCITLLAPLAESSARGRTSEAGTTPIPRCRRCFGSPGQAMGRIIASPPKHSGGNGWEACACGKSATPNPGDPFYVNLCSPQSPCMSSSCNTVFHVSDHQVDSVLCLPSFPLRRRDLWQIRASGELLWAQKGPWGVHRSVVRPVVWGPSGGADADPSPDMGLYGDGRQAERGRTLRRLPDQF